MKLETFNKITGANCKKWLDAENHLKSMLAIVKKCKNSKNELENLRRQNSDLQTTIQKQNEHFKITVKKKDDDLKTIIQDMNNQLKQQHCVKKSSGLTFMAGYLLIAIGSALLAWSFFSPIHGLEVAALCFGTVAMVAGIHSFLGN